LDLHGKSLPIAIPIGDPYSSANSAAVIPVQRIAGPMLLLGQHPVHDID
jgi:hypothetical protein